MSELCIVCSRDVPKGMKDFCCPGCSAVHTIIGQLGLHGKEKDDRIQMLLEGVFPNGEEVEDTIDESNNSQSLSFVIEGMVCPACAWLIHNRLKKLIGIGKVNVNFISELCEIQFNQMKVGEENISNAIKALGYELHEDADYQYGFDYFRFGAGWFFALNCMMISFVVYSAEHWDIPLTIKWICSILLILFGTLVPFYSARNTFKMGLRQLTLCSFRMESLVVISTSAAWIYSLISIYIGNFERLYFDVVALLLMLIETGNLITSSFYRKLHQRVHSLSWKLPKKVRIKDDNFLPINQLEAGCKFKVKRGEFVPTDGVLLDQAEFDHSLITGESSGIMMNKGHYVGAGSKLLSESALLIIPPSGRSNLLERIIESTIEAFNTKKKQPTLGDTISQIFVPVIGIIALFTLSWCCFEGYPADGFSRFLSILIVACPCAFGIAEPLVLTSAIDKIRQFGIQIFNGSILSSKVNRVVFDKTGTLTYGKPQVSSIEWLVKENSIWLDILSSLENEIEHPIAKACTGLGSPKSISNRIISHNEVSAFFEGKKYRAGSRESYPDVDIPDKLKNSTLVLFGDEKTCFLIIGLMDQARNESSELISSFHNIGIKTSMFSGDRQEVANLIGREVGIKDSRGLMKSEDKQKNIIDLQNNGEVVMMIGDGINDAQALATADIGISVYSGQIPAKMSSDGVFLKAGINALNKIPIMQSIVQKKIRLNYGWAFLYNVIGIFLAMIGWLSPKYCAVGMVFSNFVVIYNSLFWKKSMYQ